MTTYYTHDNAGRPFKVLIDDKNIVKIYKQVMNDDDDDSYEDTPSHTYEAERCFIGESPRSCLGSLVPLEVLREATSFLGSLVPLEVLREATSFLGNSILLQMEEGEYIFIGTNIFSFEAYAPITSFISLVGNSDVPTPLSLGHPSGPYPYAIDKDNNYYLLIDNVVLSNPPQTDDVYGYYYDHINKKRSKKKVQSNQVTKEIRNLRIIECKNRQKTDKYYKC